MTEELAQLTYVPIVRRPFAHAHGPFVIGGMGGSGLAGATASYLLPRTHVVIHRNYDLPQFTPENALYIAVSYSGNTEETVGFANHVLKQGKKLAIVSSGGKLADIAERYELPYVGVPEGLVPRMALMYMVRAVLAVMGADRALEEIAEVKPNIEGLVEEADEDAHFMLPAVPLIYASTRNFCLAELGKMCLNESARMPAFANQFPELNHNEMQSFDADMPQGLAHTFRFLMIKDDEDHERVTRRMDVFVDLMKDRGRSVRFMDISQKNRSEALVEVWLRFIISARLLGETRGIDPDTQPLVDEFKRLL
jgi:glucose/mannose-6-phosphate isomerase